MANVILFTDRTPHHESIRGVPTLYERFNRAGGVYKVATTLRRHGYSVLVVPNSLRLTFKGMKDFINANSKDLIYVGISTTFIHVKSHNIEKYRDAWLNGDGQTLDLSILKSNTRWLTEEIPSEMAWATKEIHMLADFLGKEHSAYLVLGGTWVSHIRDGAIDIKHDNIKIVSGQSEDYVVDFTNALRDHSEIPSQIGRDGEAKFKESFIDYVETDYITENEWLPLEIARGCAFKCAYCMYDHKGKADTTKYTRTLRDELIRNYEKWGVTRYHLTDDLYNDDERKIKTLYDEVWSKLPFKPEWISYLRLDLIWNDREQAKWLKESGCRLGSFGIETMHDKAGKFVGKGLGKERIMETLEYLREDWGDDVIVNALMIAGLPFEPEEYILKTMSWLHTTNLVHSYHYSPLWVTPPEHRNMILSQLSPMSLEYEKYKVTWGPDGWINNMGLTLKKVREMVAKDSAEHFGNYFPVDTMEYTELRAAGYTQDQLASREFNLQILDDVHNGRYNIPNLIDSRFDKIINISGQ